MIDQWIELLQSPDPQQRRQAVIALANARDPAALKPLAAVYHSDPDVELRELALKAGRYIRQEAATAHPEAPSDSADSALANTGGVSKRDTELAEFYLNAATNYQTLGDRGRAIEHLGKALSLNPARAKETYIANLILLTTDLPVDQALPVLLHPDRREAFIARTGGRRKLEKQLKDPKATWENVGVDFLLYWLVITISIAAIFLIVLDDLTDMLNEMAATAPNSSQIDPGVLGDASFIGILFAAIFYGIVYTISLAIEGGAVHLAATFIFGGDNSLLYLYRRLVPFQTWVTLGMAAALIIMLIFGSVSDIWFLMPLVMIAASVGVFWYTIELISKVYQFGWMSGCGTVIVAGILLTMLSCGANSVLAALMNTLFGS